MADTAVQWHLLDTDCCHIFLKNTALYIFIGTALYSFTNPALLLFIDSAVKGAYVYH